MNEFYTYFMNDQQMEDRKEILAHATVYEVNLRQYSVSGTFREFEEQLQRLKDMGVTILWFMPITPIGIEGRKQSPGDMGSYYAVRNYYQVGNEYGTLDEWKKLVIKMHQMGFKVILDWVANHTAPDHPWTTFHPEFYVRDGQGNLMAPNNDWTDTRKLDYDNREMRLAMIEAMSFWIRETDIDGFRCDMAKLVPVDFWAECIAKLRAQKNVIMIGESEDEGYYQAGFDAQYSWALFHGLVDLYNGRKNLWDVRQIINEQQNIGEGFRLTFTSNHDENSWNGTEYDLFEKAIKCFSVLDYTIKSGLPMIYSGQEAGNRKKLQFFTKDVIVWQENEMEVFYRELSGFRSTSEVFDSNTIFKWTSNSVEDNILSYCLSFGKEMLVVLLNMSPYESEFILHDDWLIGNYFCFETQQTIALNHEYVFKLQPWQYLRLTNKVLSANFTEK